MTQLHVTPKTRCAQGSWTGSSGTRKHFSSYSSLTPPSNQPFQLHWLHHKGRTVGELRQGVRQVRGCTKVGGRKIRASWAERKSRTARPWGSCPACPQQASPCHTHGPKPRFSPTRGHQSLPQQAVPSSFWLSQTSVGYLLPASFQQSLFLLPRFKLPQYPSFIPPPGHFPAPPFSVHPINSWVSAAWFPTSSSLSPGSCWFPQSSLKLDEEVALVSLILHAKDQEKSETSILQCQHHMLQNLPASQILWSTCKSEGCWRAVNLIPNGFCSFRRLVCASW